MNITEETSYLTPVANAGTIVVSSLLLSLVLDKNTPQGTTTFQTEYDYIVVGAGSAGSTVAARLSEEECVSVLLLEAGKPPPMLNDVPVFTGSFFFTDLDWAYKTVPQNNSGDGLINNQLIWPSGKGLGGSSLINGMLYVRGNKKNYNYWEAQGATGWSYKDVLPYFKKMENYQDKKYLKNGYHATGGPVTIEKERYEADFKKPLFEAARSMGYQIIDTNGRKQTGFTNVYGTVRNGQRCSTAKAYLVPAENRDNLDILPRAFVRKVMIRNKKAIGVMFDYKGETYRVKARKEVIMSAGTVNTAQLLMLSGVGPRQHLEDMEIYVKANLPVGENLQDHCAAFLGFTTDPNKPTIEEKIMNPLSMAEYIQNRTGVWTSQEGVDTMAFLRGLNASTKIDFPNYQLYFDEVVMKDVIAKRFGIKSDVYDQAFKPYEDKPALLCVPSLVQPKSRGTVRLNSTDPYDPPLIDPNFYANPKDLKAIVQGFKTCLKILTSEPMKNIGVKPFTTQYPGCEQFELYSDDDLECRGRSVITTLNHQVGTAKMGDPNDSTTVVDPKLRVKGIKGLRVVDASVMPRVPSGNTNVPTIMVAEKAADIIKETIKCDNMPPKVTTPDTLL